MSPENKPKGKVAQIADILSAFSQGELSVKKIAKQTGAAVSTVEGVARMNPGLVKLKGDVITILARGAATTSGLNLLKETKDCGSRPITSRGPAKSKHIRGRRVVNRQQRGTG